MDKVKLQLETSLLFPELFGTAKQKANTDPELLELITPDHPSIVAAAGLPDDFNILQLMNEAVDPLTGGMRDLKIDDRDLPLAKNYFDFSTNFCNANPPWARQMLTYLRLFGDYCPVCTKDHKWLDPLGVPVDYGTEDLRGHITLLEYGKCPKCKQTKADFVKNGLMYLYQELDLMWGQRSGKSLTGSSAMVYITHRHLKMPRLSSLAPHRIQPFTPLTGTMVSLTFSKAVSLLWAPFKSYLSMTPWFENYHKLLDHYGQKYDTELYRNKDIFVKYYHKNLHLYPSHPNASILRGDTRIFGAIDELGLFAMPSDVVKDDADETSERANAKEAINSLESSLGTVNAAVRELIAKGHNYVPMPVLFGLSSPKHVKDMVMRRFRLTQTEEGRKVFLGSHLATWEVNPTLPRDSDFIKSKFLADPIGAMRDFGAQPPLTTNTFIPHSHYTKERYPFRGAKNAIKMEYEASEEEVWGILKNAVPGKCKFPTAIALDAGYSNNSFGIAAVGLDPDNEFKVTAPAIIEIIPRGGKVINFNRVYKNILLPFTKAMNGQILLADRWNSLDLLSRIRDDIPGMQVRQQTLKPSDFDNFLQVLWNTNLVLPELSIEEATEIKKADIDDYRTYFLGKPVHHLLHQFLTVQRGGGGGCPEKAVDYTDDVFRALALGVWGVTFKTVYDIIKKQACVYANGVDGNHPVGIFVGRSGFNPMSRFRRM